MIETYLHYNRNYQQYVIDELLAAAEFSFSQSASEKIYGWIHLK